MLWAAIGLVGLYFGAEWLVSGSSRLALLLGVSPLIVGLTIVAFGTSSPELVSCLEFNLDDRGNTVMGNIVGSNICNIALVLGVAALIRPVLIKKQIIAKEMPFLLGASALFFWFIADNQVSQLEGGVLIGGILLFLFMAAKTSAKDIRASAAEASGVDDEAAEKPSGIKCMFLIFIGLIVLIAAAKLLNHSSEIIAKHFGIPDIVIGLTLIAIGTSLPELATAIVASLKREGDIITGNVVGSNVFNTLAVIGIVAAIKPIVFQQLAPIDLWFMLGLTVLIWPLLWTRRTLGRAEGGLLLAVYGVYCFFIYEKVREEHRKTPPVAVNAQSLSNSPH